MGADDARLNPSQLIRLEQLAAGLVLGEGFRPEEAIRLAADLLAEGIDSGALVQLASQPADLKVIDGNEVEVLFRTALAEVGVEPVSQEAAGWTMARWIAASMVERVVSPAEGALRLWFLWEECGRAGELSEMLQFHDAWESSVGPDRAAVEAQMLAYAPEVVAAADRFLGAVQPPPPTP
jgi:hypothetical protein